ncbi:MAG: prepilin peptidase [Halolamina sp.]
MFGAAVGVVVAVVEAAVTAWNHALADLLRLVAVPAFAWAGYRDVRTRRVPNRLWPPLLAVGVLALALEVAAHWPLAGVGDRLFLIRLGASLLFVAPLGYLFWRLGAFGGADAKAVIVLAVLVPTYPVYFVPGLPALPVVETTLGVFSLTVLTDAVLVGAAFPLALAARNAVAGRISPAMAVARVVAVDDLPTVHGRLFEDREGLTRGGLDLDALRMYLRWRGTTLSAVRADPAGHRDPAGVAETHPPTDGAVTAVSAGGDGADATAGAETDGGVPDGDDRGVAGPDRDPDAAGVDDPWAAERFLDEIDGSAYGTDPETLREGLETVVAADRVWVSPGLPFVVPLFLGLVVALTAGDVLFALLSAAGLG